MPHIHRRVDLPYTFCRKFKLLGCEQPLEQARPQLKKMSRILDNSGMNLRDIGKAVRARCMQWGLSQVQLARLRGLSRTTLAGLEAGSLNDLGVNRVGQVMSVLGLDVPAPSVDARNKKHGLQMAARNSNVSYRNELKPDVLARMLVTGQVQPPFAPQVTQFLDESPLEMLVMAAEEAAKEANMSPRKVWGNVKKLAQSLSVHRKELWS